MRNVVEEIRNEHATMARLLTLLDRQVAIFESAGHPDYALIEDIVLYFADFPDACHHPKEDLLAAMLLRKAPDRAAKLKGLEAQHEELAALTRSLVAVVRRILGEAELPRGDLIRAAREFADSQRHHIEMEEKYFLPLAEELLTGTDLAELEAGVFKQEDPLFGAKQEAHYATLREQIIEAETAEA